MSATKPIPPPPLNSTNKDDWDRWYTLVSNITIPATSTSTGASSPIRELKVYPNKTGYYVRTSQSLAADGALTYTKDLLHLHPMSFSENFTFSNARFANVVAYPTTAVILSIYDSSGPDGGPGTVLYSSPFTLLSNAYQIMDIAGQITANTVYWLGFSQQASLNLYYHDQSGLDVAFTSTQTQNASYILGTTPYPYIFGNPLPDLSGVNVHSTLSRNRQRPVFALGIA